MTNNLKDYIGKPQRCSRPVKGLGTAEATHSGTVKWVILDDKGVSHTFRIDDVYYVPSLPFRIWSPQHVSQQLSKLSWCTTFPTDIVLYWNEGEHTKTIKLNKNSNIGLMSSAPEYNGFTTFLLQENMQDVIQRNDLTCFPTNVISDDEYEDDADDEISIEHSNDSINHEVDTSHNGNGTTETPDARQAPQQIEFSDEDFNTNNIQADFPERALMDAQSELLRWHYRFGHCSFDKLRIMAQNGTIPKRLAECRIPKCPACIYGKMTKKPWRTKMPGSKVAPRTITAPGDCVSIDQLESSQPGFIAQLKGSLTRERYHAATIFVDHFSRLSYVYVHRSTTAIETVTAKHAFEQFAKGYGVSIKHYHADNGRFAENLFMADVARLGQSITFCGVNAHFQNGIAEKRIRDLQEGARTMILDAKSKWPKAINTALWPYALRQQNYAHMHTPDRSGKHNGRTPIEVFSSSEVQPNPEVFHPFGCPVYALNSDLASGKRIQKWLPRARLGIYLGFSPSHARSVALVLNPQTGLVSPQYHVKFDDLFETVNNSYNKGSMVTEWQAKSGLKVKENGKIISSKAVATKQLPKQPQEQPQQQVIPQQQVHFPSEDDVWVPEGEHYEDLPMNEQIQAPIAPQTNVQPLRRSTRTFTPTKEYLQHLAQEDLVFPIPFEALAQEDPWEEEQNLLLHPFCLAGKAGDPDTMYLDQALKEPDRAQFIDAMKKEVDSHETRQHWEMINRSQVPTGTKVLPAVWSMKRKRRAATGEVYKHKARLNVHGGRQEHGVNFWETYSPVVNWFTIRLFLILAIIFNWHTRQVDFVLAFPQADIECDMYMEIPQGFHMADHLSKKDFCLKLKKNLYGQKQAGRVWNQYLHKGLTKIGFKQSQVDECLYYRGSTMFLLYVDDGILIGPDMDDIKSVFTQLKKLKYDITDEGDLKDYLGVDIQRYKNGTVHLSQPKLIQQILSDLNFNESTKTVPYPALISEVLSGCKDEPEHKAHWSYRSIIGKLNFLEKSTRPEIAFATHQAARFSSDPREPHTRAVHRIGRYLAGTSDKGIIMKPTHLDFQVYADADYSGLWDRRTAQDDPTTAKSRTGFVIMFAGCPIIWISRLQTEIALSTTEAEYIALSESLRHVIPLMNLMDECNHFKVFDQAIKPNIHCTAFEDNSGALELARAPRMRPRTKHINIKYHHFRSHISNGRISIQAIDTKQQIADCFTKAVTQDLFLKFRLAIMGW